MTELYGGGYATAEAPHANADEMGSGEQTVGEADGRAVETSGETLTRDEYADLSGQETTGKAEAPANIDEADLAVIDAYDQTNGETYEPLTRDEYGELADEEAASESTSERIEEADLSAIDAYDAARDQTQPHTQHADPDKASGRKLDASDQERQTGRSLSGEHASDEPALGPEQQAVPDARPDLTDLDAGHSSNPDAHAEHAHGDGQITHFHSEFRGHSLDLYTDGDRWATADQPRREDLVSGKGDIAESSPTGEELVEGSGEDAPLADRLRRELYEESDDEIDILEKGTNLTHDVFSRPPTGSHEGTPVGQPFISEMQHSGIDPGSMVTALFTLGLVVDRGVRWVMNRHGARADGS